MFDSLKKLLSNCKVRAVDVDELNLVPGQEQTNMSIPQFVIVNKLLNPFFDYYKVSEWSQNVIDLIKGNRQMNSLLYNQKTIVKASMINFVLAFAILKMDAIVQATYLKSFNNDLVMRDYVKARYGITDIVLDNIIAQREEYKVQIAEVKQWVFAKTVNVGNWDEVLAPYFYEARDDDQAQYTTQVCDSISFFLYGGDVGDFLARFITNMGLTAGVSVDNDNLFWYDADPALWTKKFQSALDVMFSDSEYHSFRTDYLACYAATGLWKIDDYSIQMHKFSDADAMAYENLIMLPVGNIKSTTGAVGSQYVRNSALEYTDNVGRIMYDSSTHDTVSTMFTNQKTVQLSFVTAISFDNSYSHFKIWNSNAGFIATPEIARVDTVETPLTPSPLYVNIRKSSLAKPMEIVNSLKSSYPAPSFEISTDDDAVQIHVQIGFETFLGINAMSGTKFYEGRQVAKWSRLIQTEHFINWYRDGYGINNWRGIYTDNAVIDNVTGSPRKFMVSYNPDTLAYDIFSQQEQFDLFEVTPAATADARRQLQEAFLANKNLKLAHTRDLSFAQTLDLAKK